MNSKPVSDCECSQKNQITDTYLGLTHSDTPLAMAYVPHQHWEEPYPVCKALCAGTIFHSLYKPFCGKGGRNC